MNIEKQLHDGILIFDLSGRLDAASCDALETALLGALKEGTHQVHLKMDSVTYMSSAGLRAVLKSQKAFHSVRGSLRILSSSREVLKILRLSGLEELLILSNDSESSPETRSDFEALELDSRASFSAHLHVSSSESPLIMEFPNGTLGIGICSTSSDSFDFASTGEFVAMGGSVSILPFTKGSRPDFLISQGAYIPSLSISSAIVGTGEFSHLCRFESRELHDGWPLPELLGRAMQAAKADDAVVAFVAECQLVSGSFLSAQIPEKYGEELALRMKDHQRLTEAMVGDLCIAGVAFVSTRQHDIFNLSNPAFSGTKLFGTAQASVFSYAPLRQGRINLSNRRYQ